VTALGVRVTAAVAIQPLTSEEVSRLSMRRANGYVLTHRLLLEFLADQYTQPLRIRWEYRAGIHEAFLTLACCLVRQLHRTARPRCSRDPKVAPGQGVGALGRDMPADLKVNAVAASDIPRP
jgi:hypothetical protein